MNNELVIFHFQTLELFPPAMNFINIASKKKEFENKTTVFTTKSSDSQFQYENEKIKLVEFTGIHQHEKKLFKFLKYINIFGYVFLYLLIKKPKKVVYFETLSALPVILYYLISTKSRKPSLFIHYHELVTLSELCRGRWLNNKINSLEYKIYKHATWISQTNLKRLELFTRQYGLSLKSKIFHTLPNYPPSSWLIAPKRLEETKQKDLTKLIHIGALSTKGMYLENVLQQFGNESNFSIDFYSHKFTEEITELISKYSNCFVKGAIAYQDIPSLKGVYDVGLVLYNGSSLNFTYNAPNKIFEYLALDFDVWCSDKLITARDFMRHDCYPKMLMVDYENLNSFDVDKAIDKKGLEYVQSPYVCEPVYEQLLNEIDKDFST